MSRYIVVMFMSCDVQTPNATHLYVQSHIEAVHYTQKSSKTYMFMMPMIEIYVYVYVYDA